MVIKLGTAYRGVPGANNLILSSYPCLLHDPLCDSRFTIYGFSTLDCEQLVAERAIPPHAGGRREPRKMRYLFAEGYTGS
jgi:hypothetical protein